MSIGIFYRFRFLERGGNYVIRLVEVFEFFLNFYVVLIVFLRIIFFRFLGFGSKIFKLYRVRFRERK